MTTITIRADQFIIDPAVNSNSLTNSIKIEGGYPYYSSDKMINITFVNVVDGEIGANGGITKIEFLDKNGDIEMTLVPMNPGQIANVQPDLSGLGNDYARFSTGALVNAATGQPVYGSVMIVSCEYSGKNLPLEIPRGDGRFDVDGCKPVIPCFVSGWNRIETERGEIEISEIEVGDSILTKDNGYVPVIHVSKRKAFNTEDLPYVYIAGIGSTVMLSKHHRILVDNNLMSIRHYSNINENVFIDETRVDVEYINIFLPTHELIKANGIWVESGFLGGSMAKRIIGANWDAVKDYAKNHKPVRQFVNHRGKHV